MDAMDRYDTSKTMVQSDMAAGGVVCVALIFNLQLTVQVGLSAHDLPWFTMPAILLTGKPGIGKSTVRLYMPFDRTSMAHCTHGRSLLAG